jgi:hypothetical protein
MRDGAPWLHPGPFRAPEDARRKEWGGLGFELDKLKAYWFCIELQPEI